ncbi:hypothetical protein [Vibrio sp. ABG19]|uniref:hypothetical protein n=1 Tax=Vibrio sp. ABG19 TaxID=2817385 RepID=UPI00249F4A10|nr:hypothetical protein [Vibrio sp. ABG19]WGY45240.1 hypothetical protein J0X00_05980 [Vibrio sp. ABG19]
MAKRDWKALKKEYAQAFEETGISVKAWCVEKGINYNSARRYIQVIISDAENSDQCANSDDSAQPGTTPDSAKWPERGDHFEGEGKEKPTNSKAKAEKGKVISKSDQLTSEFSDHIQDGETNAQFLDRVLNINKAGGRQANGRFGPGHQFSAKHNAYAQRLNNPDVMFDAKNSDIDHEIEFGRARVMIAMDMYHKIGEELAKEGLATADKARLFELYKETDIAVDRNMARVESLLRTKAQVRKTELESEKLAQESAGLGTAIADIVKEIQDMESNGFVLNG